MNPMLLKASRVEREFDPASRYCSISFGDVGLGFVDDVVEDVGGAISTTVGSVVKDIWNVVDDAWDATREFIEDAWDNDLVKAAVIGAAIYYTGPAGAQWWGGASTGAGAVGSEAAMLAEAGAVGAQGAAGAAGAAGASGAAGATTTALGVGEAAATGVVGTPIAAPAALPAAGGAGAGTAAGAAELSAFGGAGAGAIPGAPSVASVAAAEGAGIGAAAAGAGEATGGGLLSSLWPDNPLAQYGMITVGGNMLGGLFAEEPDEPDPDEAARKRRERFEVDHYRGVNPSYRGRSYQAPQPYQPMQDNRPRGANGGLLTGQAMKDYLKRRRVS